MAEDNQDTFLSPVQRDALVAGAAMFIDEVFEDFVSVCNGEAVKDCPVLSECLPRQFRD